MMLTSESEFGTSLHVSSELRARPARVLAGLAGVIVVLATLSLLGRLGVWAFPDSEVMRFLGFVVNVDAESNLPSFFSALLLVSCAIGLFAISRHRPEREWAWLSVMFLVLAADELLAYHERMIIPLRDALGIERGPLYYAWVIPALVFVLAVAGLLMRFLSELDPRTRRSFVLAAVLFLGGALLFEMLGGAVATYRGEESPDVVWSVVTLVTIEEVLEMLGASVFLVSLLDYIGRELPGGGVSATLVVDNS